MSRSKYQRRREQFTRASERSLNARVDRLGRRLLTRLVDLINRLTTDERGRIQFNVRNLSTVNQVASEINNFHRQQGFSLLRWAVGRLLRLFGFNRQYFQAFDDSAETVEARVVRVLFAQYGYDVSNDRIDRNGYLARNLTSNQHALNVSRAMNQAIAGRMNLNEFRQQFRQEFLKATSPLSLEHHYRRFTFDLFQDFDRTAQLQYAEQLGLNHATYSGTIKNNTRPFCRRRVNNIYTVAEINSWNNQNWKGKRPGVDVKVALGGYNCRHHLNYLSEGMARRLADDRGGINDYD